MTVGAQDQEKREEQRPSGYRNHVRKFLRALSTKWRPKVMAIEESKDLSTLPLDELIGNLKVYEVVLEKDLEIFKNKKEKYKSLALKARKVQSEEEATSSESNDEEYVMTNFWKVKEDKKEKDDQRCFKCGDLNHFISDCPKHSFSDQKAFIFGCWSDSEDNSKKEEICLMAIDSNEVCLKVKLELDEWIKDSGCSRHMTGNKYLFSSYKTIGRENQEKVLEIKENEPLNKEIVNIKESKDHPLETIIEPKNVKEGIQDESWTMAMQEELNQFKTNDVWSLVPPPNNQTIIARLVAQGYNQQEGIDFDETYALIARLESIRILLACACTHDFKLYQMDVKSVCLNGFIKEEVYVAQPPGFIDFEKHSHVFKLKKALYGLKEAPKAWYNILKPFSSITSTPWD
ncbi:retrovirus-related pol polyprotein from transposon TNT 1-94 [Tanacetum coccineum]|uniref:Retrovirus-related pol polyprotein from transposon TNT 1-94 n=1 Tax=Tanacetum coccineum TaxID=301880 RepID=A0ABQ5GYE8_9ASTR